ncbi:carbonic anhydrase 2-like [Culicoides brevitarsis]|uniref:carbonic anhydrase 2-like n=1 Tax=Culicoides brevitarsis TaxID=469753 RepID=UPI00307C77B5
MKKSSIIIFGVFLLTTQVRASGHDSWEYPKAKDNGVMPEEHWGERCDLGRRQSPVDLNTQASVHGIFPAFTFANYDEAIKGAAVVNTGHSLQINAHPSQKMLVMGGGLPGTYEFDQLHFHWGSEHTINGRREAVEVHLVHHESRFESLGAAAQVKRGIAVLGVLFHIAAEPNPTIEQILIASEAVKEHVGRNQSLTRPLELEDLLPKDRSSYFRYEGSLTTPGCFESVVWTVWKESLPISIEQVERFKTLKSDKGQELTNNYRSVKPLGSRALVYVSGEEEKSAGTVTGVSSLLSLASMIALVKFFSQ